MEKIINSFKITSACALEWQHSKFFLETVKIVSIIASVLGENELQKDKTKRIK